MKKNLLIVSHALELGGAERSLIGLLDALNPKEWSVDLFLLRHEGELMEMIPAHVKLLPKIDAYTVLARPMIDTLREGHILLTAARLAGKIAANGYAKIHHHTDSAVSLEYSHKYTYRLLPNINPDKEYDLAISFLTPHYIVANRVKARKKIAWIHTDYTRIQINVSSETVMWGAYDYIASISEAATEGFLQVFPSLQAKMILMENILPERIVKKQAIEFNVENEMPEDGNIRLLSIGRYCTAKNFDNVPWICKQILQSGLKIKWYIIGYGGDEQLIRQEIHKAGMEDYVILLGKKDNPYPYITACDLYVQPSRYEGKCVTVREAQMLGKPVVITRYATSSSQLEDGIDGIIVPMDNEGCTKGIIKLLQDSNKIKSLIEECHFRDYSNQDAVLVLRDCLKE